MVNNCLIFRQAGTTFSTESARKSLILADCRPIRPRFHPFHPGRTKRPRMAGHSQFKNIMHRKGRQDAQKSKLFSKLAREITVAAKMGPPDPAMNARLRAAIISARQENMSKDSIERAVKKAIGARRELRRDPLRGLRPRRRRGDRRGADRQPQPRRLRHPLLLHQSGGNLGETGSVAFMFDRTGIIEYDAKVASDDAMLDAAIDAGADDVVSSESGHESTPRRKPFARWQRRWRRNSAKPARRS